MGAQNRINTDITLADLLNLTKKELMLSINCHAIATVQSFDATKQTVVATMNYLKSFQQADSKGKYSTVTQSYTILLDCPVVFPQGGGGFLTFPIQKGDTCLIFFNDRDMDSWFYSGQVREPDTQRMHSFSDGIALVGLRSANNAIAGFDTDRARLQKGTSYIGVGKNDLIKVANATRNLGTLLQSLFTALETFGTAAGGASTVAQVAAAATVLNASVLTISTEVAELIE